MQNNTVLEFVKNNIFFLLGGACIVIVGIIFIISRGGAEQSIVPILEVQEENDEYEIAYEEPLPEPSYVVVHITGAVNESGVFSLPLGSRVNDALYLAGGGTEYADLVRINLAVMLEDAMQIIVPAIGDDLEDFFVFSNGGSQAVGITNGRVNINTATSAELQTLSGIGPARAQSIIDFRETHGNFASVDELIHISGIGAITLENLRPHVTAE
jgi:competence protein ComEA